MYSANNAEKIFVRLRADIVDGVVQVYAQRSRARESY
jgi:hypothetical protein